MGTSPSSPKVEPAIQGSNDEQFLGDAPSGSSSRDGNGTLVSLDALRDATKDIGLIVCRHEGAATNMAEAYGKLTGAPGTILLHQERTYPGRAYGTDLKNPDFAAFAHLFNRNINAVLPN